MRPRAIFPLSVILWFGLTTCAISNAAGTVRLELIGDSRGAAMAFQEWAQALGRAGVNNVRIRSTSEPGKPAIDIQGTEQNPIYVVTGIILSRHEIELPGRRFRLGEAGLLARWLDDLAENGPAASRPKRGAFGLTAEELERVKKDLAVSVDFDTLGMQRRRAVEKIAARLNPPMRIDDRLTTVLGDAKVEDELNGLARGTALAYLLRAAGMCFAPRVSRGVISYEPFPLRRDAECWPVGTDIDSSAHDALPALFEFHNVNVQNVSIALAIRAIGKRLGAPVLIDRNALAHYEIDLEKAAVSHPRSRTIYAIALRKLLFQARLKYEVRRDAGGSPFLWITTLKPM